LEGDGVILKFGVLAGELLVGAVLCEHGANEGSQILTQLDADEEDETVREDHPEQHPKVGPLAARRLNAIHLLHHVPAGDGWPQGLAVENEVVECETYEFVQVHALQAFEVSR
jgi:hypothetical protein